MLDSNDYKVLSEAIDKRLDARFSENPDFKLASVFAKLASQVSLIAIEEYEKLIHTKTDQNSTID